MTTRRLPLVILILAAAAILNGCGGSSGQAAKPAVGLSVLAPMSGSTVGVRDVTVAGTVSPATATVLVSGQPANVVDGRYSQTVTLAGNSQTITITGQAHGYAPGTESTTVQYSARIASALAASHLGQAPGSNAATNSHVTHAAKAKPHHKAAAHKPAPKPASQPAPAATTVSDPKPTSSPAPALTNTKPEASAHTTSKKHSSKKGSSKQGTSKQSKKHPSKNGGSKQGTSKQSSHTRKTTQSRHKSTKRTLTVADIKKLWIQGCVKAGKGNDYVSYCKCTYAHLEAAGALRTRDRLLALARELDRYARTQNFAQLPRYVRMAMSTCASKLPPLDPMTGAPTITKLPGLSHNEASDPSSPATPPASAPTSTTPPATPTPAVSGTPPNQPHLVRSASQRASHATTRHRAGHRTVRIPRAHRSLLNRRAMHNIDLALHALVRYRPAIS